MKEFLKIIFLLLFLTACGGEEDASQTPSSKTAHFDFHDYVLRSFSDDNVDITIRIPECFEKDDYGSYSVNENWMLKCYDNYSFLTIDYFSAEDIENYFYYYGEEDEEMGDHLEYLLEFVVNKRANNLIDPEISLQTTAENTQRSKFLFQSVTGRETNYKDNLFFLFGAVELNGQYFIVQAICSFNSLKFHLSDFKKMMMSVKRK